MDTTEFDMEGIEFKVELEGIEFKVELGFDL